MSEEKSPIDLEDLLGLVTVKVKRVIESSSRGIKVFIVEFNGREYRFGVIGEEPLKSVLKHGWKEQNGSIYLKVPRTALREEGCGWINKPY